MINRKKQLLGAHVSIAGALEASIIRGEQTECTCIQIFVKSNRQWAPPVISAEAIKRFKDRLATSTIKDVITHATYLINVCSENEEVRKKSAIALEKELIACDELDIPYLVLHPGSNGTNRTQALSIIAQTIDRIYEKNTIKTMILLETMAGQGSTIGKTFEEISAIINQVNHKSKVGVCIDTCHIFAAGYDIRTPESYTNTMNEFDRVIGFDKLKVFHLNDSKKDLGSNVDRHEDIGKGCIGAQAFALIMNDSRFVQIPKIIETPQDDFLVDVTRNLKTLKDLIK